MSGQEKKPSVERFEQHFEEIFRKNKFVVFLCGPSLNSGSPSANLRQQFITELELDGFEVVLGEDDGLEYLRNRYSSMAHENELQYINQEASAIVLIADSVGSFCELGLFSYTFYKEARERENQYDFVLLVNNAYEGQVSYFNEGPAAAVDAMGGKVFFGDFSCFDTAPVIKRLRQRRAVWFSHGKGRPSVNSI